MGGALRAELWFWRGPVDEVVARYLDGGTWDRGFARVRCGSCPEEFLVALEQVGHAQWVFTVPKILRVYFLHHRGLTPAASRELALR